jgi:hypothetical protein
MVFAGGGRMSCCGQKAKAILFPEPRMNEGYGISSAADDNLAGAIYDLTSMGHVDILSLKTLDRVLSQLREAREALG